MQRLNALYKDLLHAVKEEALLMEQIFPDPTAALAAFISRVFEQKIKARRPDRPDADLGPRALLRMLTPCGTQA